MTTTPDEVRGGLEVLTAAALAELARAMREVPPDLQMSAFEALLPGLIPGFYDGSAALAIAWYEELRNEADPSVEFAPSIIGAGNYDWILTELAQGQARLAREAELEIEQMAAKLVAEAEALIQKEVARGFRATIDGNTVADSEAIGWSRHTRPGACKFCLMLARDGVVYRNERGARFAAHTTCHCIARPEFANGEHGPEADVYQYLASQRERTPQERKKLRDYLNAKYPDAPG